MSIRLGVLAVALMFVIGCQGPIAPGYGRVSGHVTAPTTPLGNEIAPASGKSVLFIPEAGGQAHVVITGPDGHYSVDLGAGTYEVQLDGYDRNRLYDGVNPKTYGQWPRVVVTAGQETKFNLIYHSG